MWNANRSPASLNELINNLQCALLKLLINISHLLLNSYFLSSYRSCYHLFSAWHPNYLPPQWIFFSVGYKYAQKFPLLKKKKNFLWRFFVWFFFFLVYIANSMSTYQFNFFRQYFPFKNKRLQPHFLINCIIHLCSLKLSSSTKTLFSVLF